MNLPTDIKSYVKSYIGSIITKWLVTTAGIIILLCVTNSSFDVANEKVKSFIYTALLIAPIFIFKIPKLFFDRSWSGVIKRLFTDDELHLESRAFLTTQGWNSRDIVVYAEVQLDNKEETQIVELYRGKYDNQSASLLSIYEVGNKVIHIKGTKSNQIISEKKITCVVCGGVNKKSSHVCSECGHTLDLSGITN